MKRFLHTLQQGSENGNYLVADREWIGWGWSMGDNLRLDLDGAGLSVRGEDEGFAWDFTVKMADGPESEDRIYFRNGGRAETVEEACLAALEYSPEKVLLEYLGKTYVCLGVARKNGGVDWKFVSDGEEVEVSGPHKWGEDPEYFAWKRSWSPAKKIFTEFCGGDYATLNGKASTFKDAMIAGVDAPELFKRAIAKLVASLSREGE